MAKQKGRPKKKTNQKTTQNNKLDLTFITLLIISFILMIIVYGKSGVLSKTIDPALGGIFGPIKYIVPVGGIILCIILALDNKNENMRKVMHYSAIIALLAAFLSVIQITQGSLPATIDFGEGIEKGYELGASNQGGGVIGTLIGLSFVKILGDVGAILIIMILLAFLLMYLFEISPTEQVKKFASDIEDARRERALIREKYTRSQNDENIRKPQEMKQLKYNLEDGSIREETVKKSSVGLFNIFRNNKPKASDSGEVRGRANNESMSSSFRMEDPILMRDPVGEFEEAEESKNFGSLSEQSPQEFRKENIQRQEKIGQAIFTEEKPEKIVKQNTVMNLETDDIVYEDYDYDFPSLDLLKEGKVSKTGSKKMIEDTANELQQTLYSFGVKAKVMNVSMGPSVARYELKPEVGVKVSRISNLQDDIALNLAAESIRIEAPIPGKQAVGIEVPNKTRQPVTLREVLETDEFNLEKSKIAFALGRGVGGEAIVADIYKMPHLLVAGSTGSGKSVCINTIITSIIYKADPNDVKFIMIDPKVVELSMYNSIPHLLVPVITDAEKASAALKWAVSEMIKRYNKFAKAKVKDLDSYNKVADKEEKMPKLIVLIDELADLMLVAAKEVEDSICRIAQMGRASGIHLVIATQRPSVDVITGLIKANVPSRIAFTVSSNTDSRTILDMGGAEKLLGKGDMLYYPIGSNKPTRVQGAFIGEDEINKVVNSVKREEESELTQKIEEEIKDGMTSNDSNVSSSEDSKDDKDELLMDAIEMSVKMKKASISALRRRFRIGDSRAGRIIDDMERMGIISAPEGNKPRRVLVSEFEWSEIKHKYENGESDIDEIGSQTTFDDIEKENSNSNSNINSNVNSNINSNINKQNNVNIVKDNNYEDNSNSNNHDSEFIDATELDTEALNTEDKDYEPTIGDVERAYEDSYEENPIGRDNFSEDSIDINDETMNTSGSLNSSVKNLRNRKEGFKISRSTIRVDRNYVEKIISITTKEPYFMDAIEDMLEDNEISEIYLRRKYGLNQKRAENILDNMEDLKMIIRGKKDTIITITEDDWDKINDIFMDIT